MSFSPVLGRSSAVALVWTRSLYSGSMSISIDGVAVLELDAADVADAHAGDAHGLALAGDHGLRGRELGLQLVAASAWTNGKRMRCLWRM